MTSVKVAVPGPAAGWAERMSTVVGQLRTVRRRSPCRLRPPRRSVRAAARLHVPAVRAHRPRADHARHHGPGSRRSRQPRQRQRRVAAARSASPRAPGGTRGDRTDLRVYTGPEPDPALADAAAEYWNHVLTPAHPVTGAEVTVGAGTVNLWDCVIRQYLRPGDGVVVATPTYGFFLPHVTRAGGVLIGLPTRGREYSGTQLTDVVRDHDTAALESWERTGGIQRLRGAFATRFDDAAADALTEASLTVLAPARGPAAVARAVLDVALPADLDFDANVDPGCLVRLLTEYGPPRAALLLHLNPTLSGAVHDREQTRAVARAADDAELRVVEDLSYFPVRCAGHDVVSIREFSSRTVSLLGVSKVLGIADLRIGLAISHPDDGAALMRRVEELGRLCAPIRAASGGEPARRPAWHRSVRREVGRGIRGPARIADALPGSARTRRRRGLGGRGGRDARDRPADRRRPGPGRGAGQPVPGRRTGPISGSTACQWQVSLRCWTAPPRLPHCAGPGWPSFATPSPSPGSSRTSSAPARSLPRWPTPTCGRLRRSCGSPSR